MQNFLFTDLVLATPKILKVKSLVIVGVVNLLIIGRSTYSITLKYIYKT